MHNPAHAGGASAPVASPFFPHALTVAVASGVAALVVCATASAQRAAENAVASAPDGFGTSVGNERVGIYTPRSVRGLNPIVAGNRRIDGLYFDLGGNGLTNRLTAGSFVRVGLPALAYPFPAPSGIVDYELRKAGTEPALGVVAASTFYGGRLFEVDAQVPALDGRLRIGAGAGHEHSYYSDGRDYLVESMALIPSVQWDGGSLTGFWSQAKSRGDATPIMVTRGPVLPPVIETNDFRGQPWADELQKSDTRGLLGAFVIGEEFGLRWGLFESRSTRYRTFSDLFLDVQPDGSAENIVISEPVLPARWTSGEVRLSWNRRTEVMDHALHLSLRGRDKELFVGGGGSASLGTAVIGRLTPAPQPEFRFGTPTISRVDQTNVGIAYLGRWRERLEFNLGLQRADYTFGIERDGVQRDARDTPLLHNATLAWVASPDVAVFGGTTTGLEETAAPPSRAVNRDDPVPASRTRQWDAGVRWQLGSLRLVASAFQIQRPYYGLNGEDVYTALGDLRNRGLEFSLAGTLHEDMTVVAGLVLMDPQVIGEAREAGRTGERPVGIPTRTARVDLDQNVPAISGLSLTATIAHGGPAAASTAGYDELGGRQLELDAYTTLDLGARYRFALRGKPVTARLLAGNVFDDRGYTAPAGNTFTMRDSRHFSLQLSADF